MKYIASCSNGKDSLAMVLTLIEKKLPLDCVIFVDLGMEFKSIYDTWDRLCVLLDKAGIEHKRLTLSHSFNYYFSEHEIKTRSHGKKYGYSWCGGRTRWGTTFKKQLIDNFYRNHFGDEVICEYVGIAQDELSRVSIKREHNVKIYPLILWGMTENDCLTKCYKAGFKWQEENGVELYQVLDRVSCFCCGNKNLSELSAIYHNLPSYWQKLKEMQSRTSIPYKDGRTVDDLERRFEE